jgi:choloylglycine hydrolase
MEQLQQRFGGASALCPFWLFKRRDSCFGGPVDLAQAVLNEGLVGRGPNGPVKCSLIRFTTGSFGAGGVACRIQHGANEGGTVEGHVDRGDWIDYHSVRFKFSGGTLRKRPNPAGEVKLKRSFIRTLIAVSLVQFFVLGSLAYACTTFCIDDGEKLVFGRNYDWDIGVGLVMVNKRGLSKTALLSPSEVPARWVSKYGSVTFNQYGREFPTGGINEKGLVVEQMWLQETKYPARDERPALTELTWIQYQLDKCKTVDEVIATDSKLRIMRNGAPLHFLICDRAGQAAVIEFIDGKMVVHRAKELPYKALANSTYEKSLSYLKSCRGFGGEKVIAADSVDSLDRFAKAVYGIEQYAAEKRGDAIAQAFKILEEVSLGEATRWSIVYDVKNLAVQFKTGKSPKIKSLNLKDFDFNCNAPCRVLDIDCDLTGDVHALFIDYTTEINKKLIYDSWKSTSWLKDTPDIIMNMVASHPDHFTPVKEEEAPKGQ